METSHACPKRPTAGKARELVEEEVVKGAVALPRLMFATNQQVDYLV